MNATHANTKQQVVASRMGRNCSRLEVVSVPGGCYVVTRNGVKANKFFYSCLAHAIDAMERLS